MRSDGSATRVIGAGVSRTSSRPLPVIRNAATDKAKNKLFDETLMEHGIVKPPAKIYVGVCHDDDDVAKTLAAFQAGVDAVRD